MSTILTASNFLGNLTRFGNGALNSGKAVDRTSFGYHPWSVPGTINFNDSPTDITGGVVTDAIIDGKSRVESGILYQYCIGHTGKFYKIQVNNPTTKEIDYNNPTLITTLTSGTTFTMGGSLIISGSTAFIGHDAGITSIGLNGTGETIIGDSALWTSNVPRQGISFLGNMYFTNGNNIATLNSSGVVTAYQTIQNVPSNQIFKSITVDKMGKNIILISSDVNNTSLITSDPNYMATYAATSLIFRWEPRSNTVLSTQSLYFDQTAAYTLGEHEFIWGYDTPGGSMLDISEGLQKIISGTGTALIAQAPTANAIAASGNLVGWATVEPAPSNATSNSLNASVFAYGNLDADESNITYARLASFPSTLSSGDILRVPWINLVGNIQTGGNTSGYGSPGVSQNQLGQGNIYMSTVEWNGVAFKYGLYTQSVVTNFLDPAPGVYETQALVAGATTLSTATTFTPTLYKVYMENATGYEQFKVDLIGIDGNPLASGTTIFSAIATGGSIVTIHSGDVTLSSASLSMAATPVLGIRVTNSGQFTPFIHKIDVTVT